MKNVSKESASASISVMGGGYHYARIDSIQEGLFDQEPVVLVQVLGELKVVSPDCLEKIKRPKKRV